MTVNITSYRMHDLVYDFALDLSKPHSVTVKENHELNHIFRAIYLRIDEGILDIKGAILKRNFEKAKVLYDTASTIGDILSYSETYLFLC